MRLFAALWPPEQALADLRVALAADPGWSAGLRPTAAQRLHLTLCFYGDDADPDERAAMLDRHVAGLAGPRLVLQGAGAFPRVLWVGVRPVAAVDAGALRALVAATGSDPKGFRPHLTVARGRRGRPSVPPVLAGYRGPTWTATEVALVASDRGPGGSHYTVRHRVALGDW